MTISGGGSRVTGMTIAEAQQILNGSPTQEELFTALVTLARSAPDEYEPALSRAAEILTAQNRSEVPVDQVDAFVQQLLGATESQPADDLTAGAVPPPPPPDPEALQVQAGPSPIGVPSDFRTERIDPSSTLRSIDRIREPVAPRYRSGDEDDFMSKSPTEIRRLQRELERAGLLTPGGYVPGFWDQGTSQAMFAAMGFANQRGSTWDAVVREFQSMPRQVQREEFDPEPYMKPDPATLAQDVKGAIRERLGREPTDEELHELAGVMSGLDRESYDRAVAIARAEFEAGQEPDAVSSGRAFQSDIGGRDVGSGTASPEAPSSFAGFDAAARFAELFDRRFRPEMQFIEGQQETAQNMNSVFASLRTMGSLIG